MTRKIRFAQFGIGTMGKRMIPYAIEKGCRLVAAFARNAQVGQDVGELCGIGHVGVAVSHIDDAAAVLARTKPDVCLVTTVGTMEAMMPIFKVCAEAGCNVITIAEWATYPYTADPELAAEADRLAKAHGVTIASSGGTEVGWGTLLATLASCTQRVERILVEGMTNQEVYGPAGNATYPDHGINFTMEQFKEKFGGRTFEEIDGHWPCLPGDQNGFACALLRLTPVRQYAYYEPLTYDKPVFSKVLDTYIPAGNLLGMVLHVVTETKEGTVVEFALGGKVFTPEDTGENKITLTGEPTLVVTMEGYKGPIGTCATPVNRIPDVLNAEPGFLTADHFNAACFVPGHMEKFVTASLRD